ncbi:MAG: sensor histidine kinase [Bacteroidota bacterium]
MKKIAPLFTRSALNDHLLFWLLVFLCYCVSNWGDFDQPIGVFLLYGTKVLIQIMLAYSCLLYLLPRYETDRKLLPLALGLIGFTLVGHTIFTTSRALIMEPWFPEAFESCARDFIGQTLWQRLTDYEYALFINPATLYPPTFVLLAIQHFQKQRQISELNEQKRTAELSALKNQLNPHFLFNTLNNLYTLALKKSDQTAVAIAKLSDILDYILYRCNAALVSLNQEVDLLQNYIALEKIRYGQRVAISLQADLAHPQKIAPLILLTFLENAFKHGVSQEVGQAQIAIQLATTPTDINFRISNTIPTFVEHSRPDHPGIGLDNIRQQLSLLYPDRHQLNVDQQDNNFTIQLHLTTL